LPPHVIFGVPKATKMSSFIQMILSLFFTPPPVPTRSWQQDYDAACEADERREQADNNTVPHNEMTQMRNEVAQLRNEIAELKALTTH